ncbi:MAG: UDP-N-acetylglucosamine 2-epimerase (non-hydrolyzing) [Bacteroidota bacterium]
MKKIIAVIGARPQFIKHAAVDLRSKGHIQLLTIHTGQHYDHNMSAVFFDQLNMSQPHYLLETGGLGHGQQTGRMMAEIETIVLDEKPDGLLVYGDTNSTLAGALVAAKLHIPLVHVEAGLRSYNKKMPEEINRVLTDHCSDHLLTTSDVAIANLQREGITEGVTHVGDVMLDMIRISEQYIRPAQGEDYYYCTLHRPYNVDEGQRLAYILEQLNGLDKKVRFPMHPRTRHKATAAGLDLNTYENIDCIEPASYFDNIGHLAHSSGLITDSGGMQKEAYWLKKRCITIRSETEWTETVDHGWNTLLFEDLSQIEAEMHNIPQEQPPLYGDGKAAERIVHLLKEL